MGVFDCFIAFFFFSFFNDWIDLWYFFPLFLYGDLLKSLPFFLFFLDGWGMIVLFDILIISGVS